LHIINGSKFLHIVFVLSNGNCQPKLANLTEDIVDLLIPSREILVALKLDIASCGSFLSLESFYRWK
jgi:hypothetical protein